MAVEGKHQRCLRTRMSAFERPKQADPKPSRDSLRVEGQPFV